LALKSRSRSRFDVVASILEASLFGIPKAHMPQQRDQRHTRLEKHLGKLLGLGFLEKGGNGKTYRTTARGLAFLKDYHIHQAYSDKIKEFRRRWSSLHRT